MKLILFLGSLLATSCLVGASARTGATHAPGTTAIDPIPPAKSGITLVVERGAEPVLEHVLTEYERATGVHLVVSRDVSAQLASTSCGLSQTLDIPAGRVHSTIGRLLVQHGFLLTLLQAEEPVLLGVENAQDPTVRARAWSVPAEEIAAMSEHPALLVSTLVTMRHTNARDLSKSVHQLSMEPNVQQMVPLGRSNSLMLIGRGADVATLAGTLVELDELERQARVEEERREAERRAERKGEPEPK